jgi:hypothetical protein
MFPEYRDLISQLKQSDKRFARLFDEHNELDEKIANMVKKPVTGNLDEVEVLKKQKLHLKDQLYQILKQHDKK